MAGPGRHGPGADGDERASASPGTRRRGSGARATAGRKGRNSTWSPSTTASSAIYCACSAANGCKVTVVPATDFGRGYPCAQAGRRVPVERSGRPGGDRRICGAGDQQHDRQGHPDVRHLPRPPDARHRASAARTRRSPGHHGANHPVKDLTTGKVEITSMNHGFAVDRASLPANVGGDARIAVRRLELRDRAQGQAGVFGAVSSRSVAGATRQPVICSNGSRR